MSTLGEMVDKITGKLARPDLETETRDAIRQAIADYAHREWFFSESRECSFNTVVGQIYYTAADHAMLPLLEKVHYVRCYIGTSTEPVEKLDPERFENKIAEASLHGEPRYYCWYGRKFGFYPVSNQPYPIRIGGVFKPGMPTTDEEAGNPWMTEAWGLIFNKAQFYIFRDDIRNMDMAEAKIGSIEEQESILITRSNFRGRSGRTSRVEPDIW